VVKNVAGYDLGKLMIGSAGTLAVITDATFRLHPVPVAHRWVAIEVHSPREAQEVVQSVLHAQAVPSAIEVDWVDGRGAVSVLLEGREEGVAGRTDTVRRLLGESSSESGDAPAGGAAYPWDLGATDDQRATALKLTFVLSGLADVLTAAAEAGAVVRGSAGTGVVYAALPPGTGAETVRTSLDLLRRICAQHGGTVVVVDAPAAVKAGVDVWGAVPALDLMRRVKDQFDPDQRLAPGRFVGDI
jgi:glycolate oxidase FAD binding subunit